MRTQMEIMKSLTLKEDTAEIVSYTSFRNQILNDIEMYEENLLWDDEDVFGGTEDSYANEMVEQHLFDTIYYNIKNNYDSQDAAMNTAQDVMFYLLDFVKKGEVNLQNDQIIKEIYDKYVVNNMNESTKNETFEVWQKYYDEDGTPAKEEFVQSFDDYKKADKFCKGLMKDGNCEAWVKDKSEELTEAEETIFDLAKKNSRGTQLYNLAYINLDERLESIGYEFKFKNKGMLYFQRDPEHFDDDVIVIEGDYTFAEKYDHLGESLLWNEDELRALLNR
jgi:hypothetical protein